MWFKKSVIKFKNFHCQLSMFPFFDYGPSNQLTAFSLNKTDTSTVIGKIHYPSPSTFKAWRYGLCFIFGVHTNRLEQPRYQHEQH